MRLPLQRIFYPFSEGSSRCFSCLLQLPVLGLYQRLPVQASTQSGWQLVQERAPLGRQWGSIAPRGTLQKLKQ